MTGLDACFHTFVRDHASFAEASFSIHYPTDLDLSNSCASLRGLGFGLLSVDCYGFRLDGVE